VGKEVRTADVGFFDTARKWIQRATLYVSYLGMILLIPMMLLTSADVMGRAVWSRPIYGTVELSSYMLAIFILLGVAYTHQVKGHVRVSMLLSRVPRRAGLVLDVITILLSLFIVALLAAFFRQDGVVGIGLVNDLDDFLLGTAVHLADEIVVAFTVYL
jgi:TRAP-type mannitol/chloroaromatic compound transport system permease small subunit